MNRRKHRGRDLERRIERVFDQLNALPGFICLRLEVRTILKGGKLKRLLRQPCDYVIITRNDVYLFDAKECSAMKWYPKKAPEHQRQALQKALGMGHRAGFVVWFRKDGNVPGGIRWIDDFVNPATVESGRAFGWEMFFE